WGLEVTSDYLTDWYTTIETTTKKTTITVPVIVIDPITGRPTRIFVEKEVTVTSTGEVEKEYLAKILTATAPLRLNLYKSDDINAYLTGPLALMLYGYDNDFPNHGRIECTTALSGHCDIKINSNARFRFILDLIGEPGEFGWPRELRGSVVFQYRF
ncbi:unnamed protein product, partial [marine sediment metagenome]